LSKKHHHAEPTPDTPQQPAADATAEAPEQVEDRSSALARERDEYKEHWLRSVAELQNAKRRAQQELQQVRRMAAEALITELIPVLDNFERTLQAAESGATHEALIEGVRAIDRQLRAALKNANLTRMEVVGQPFDPEHHEAVAVLPSGEHDDDTVVDELEAGYLLSDKVVRPARVRVAKKQ
jgi:molecular chaperone GrpE